MNSRDGVYMDIPAVRNISKRFNTISEVLKNVSRVLQALITTLKTTAFVGMVGGLALAHYMETIKPFIDNMSKKCAELSKDLSSSIDAYERGDAQGATRFY
ncbi:MAG: hypothetical protein KDE53_23570 [Caldilineaceae bacterium]|nr:hypothetical protein [Caldilineaceae bacterium]MCB0123700.1 hypothetical protein [Caldilineaceae bacterium]HRW06766.1 hypothetical protein [Caldilineaceae bacterium]